MCSQVVAGVAGETKNPRPFPAVGSDLTGRLRRAWLKVSSCFQRFQWSCSYVFSGCGRCRGRNKKPTTVSSRGFRSDGPTSARLVEGFFVLPAISVVLLICVLRLWPVSRAKQKTHDRFQPWVPI